MPPKAKETETPSPGVATVTTEQWLAVTETRTMTSTEFVLMNNFEVLASRVEKLINIQDDLNNIINRKMNAIRNRAGKGRTSRGDDPTTPAASPVEVQSGDPAEQTSLKTTLKDLAWGMMTDRYRLWIRETHNHPYTYKLAKCRDAARTFYQVFKIFVQDNGPDDVPAIMQTLTDESWVDIFVELGKEHPKSVGKVKSKSKVTTGKIQSVDSDSEHEVEVHQSRAKAGDGKAAKPKSAKPKSAKPKSAKPKSAKRTGDRDGNKKRKPARSKKIAEHLTADLDADDTENEHPPLDLTPAKTNINQEKLNEHLKRIGYIPGARDSAQIATISKTMGEDKAIDGSTTIGKTTNGKTTNGKTANGTKISARTRPPTCADNDSESSEESDDEPEGGSQVYVTKNSKRNGPCTDAESDSESSEESGDESEGGSQVYVTKNSKRNRSCTDAESDSASSEESDDEARVAKRARHSVILSSESDV